MFERVALTPVFSFNNAYKLRVILEEIIKKIGFNQITREELIDEIRVINETSLTEKTEGALLTNLLATGLITKRDNLYHLTENGFEYFKVLREKELQITNLFITSFTRTLEGVSQLLIILKEEKNIHFDVLLEKWRAVHNNPNWKSNTTWRHQLNARLQWLQAMNIILRYNKEILLQSKLD